MQDFENQSKEANPKGRMKVVTSTDHSKSFLTESCIIMWLYGYVNEHFSLSFSTVKVITTEISSSIIYSLVLKKLCIMRKFSFCKLTSMIYAVRGNGN